MGMFFHAKCENCWDPLPCGCPQQAERDASAAAYARNQAEERERKTHRLLKEQNALLRELREQVALLRLRTTGPKHGD